MSLPVDEYTHKDAAGRGLERDCHTVVVQGDGRPLRACPQGTWLAGEIGTGLKSNMCVSSSASQVKADREMLGPWRSGEQQTTWGRWVCPKRTWGQGTWVQKGNLTYMALNQQVW